MNENLSSFFSGEASFAIWGTSKRIQFGSLEELKTWGTDEKDFWKALELESYSDHTVGQIAGSQISRMRSLYELCEEIKKWQDAEDQSAAQRIRDAIRTLRNYFGSIESGDLLCRDSPVAQRIKIIAEHYPQSAWVYRVIQHPNLEFHNRIPVGVLIRAAIDASSIADVRGEIDQAQSRISDLFNQAQQQIVQTTSARETEEARISHFWDVCKKAVDDRNTEWGEQKKDFAAQWASMKKAYDEQMALASPTTYWKEKATRHLIAAVVFAFVFGVVIWVGLYQFFTRAAPELSQIKPGEVPWSVLIPAILCAFVAIWVLRIIGRQLSSHLQLLEDAGERQAMVKTFLALVHDETRGKALVTDNDRILILHALFRPSHLKAIDDAPPAHWFDLLTSKMGEKSNP